MAGRTEFFLESVRKMGTKVPETWPLIIGTDWYKVYVDCYQGSDPFIGCSAAYIHTIWGCVTGAELNDWITGDKDCSQYEHLVDEIPQHVQRLKYIAESYSTMMTCWLS